MSKFNELNTAFNTDDDLIQPEVVEKKIEKVKANGQQQYNNLASI